MPRRVLFAARGANGKKLVVVCLVAGLAIPGVVWYRAHVTSESDRKLCGKIDKLDASFYGFVSHSKPLKPRQYGYDYWRLHHLSEPNGAPGGKPSPELIALLKAAACDPRNLR